MTTGEQSRAVVLSALLVLSVVAGTVALGGTAAAAPSTVYVDSDNTGSTNVYGSIDTAINNVADGGTVIINDSNTYHESLSISKSVIIEAADGASPTLNASGLGTAVAISSGDVVVDGLRIVGADDTRVIDSQGTSLTVVDTHIVVNATGRVAAEGIFTNAKLVVKDSRITGQSGKARAIRLVAGSDSRVVNTTVENTLVGVHWTSADNVTVTGSTLTNIGAEAVLVAAESNNNVTDATVTHNNFSDVGQAVYFLENNAVLTGTLTVAYNNFDNADTAGYAVATAHGSVNFDGSGDLSQATVNATRNWWGAADGPSGAVPGSGDKLDSTADVTYEPWLDAPAPGGDLESNQRTVTATPDTAGANANHVVSFGFDASSQVVNSVVVSYSTTNVSAVTAGDLDLTIGGQSVNITGVSKPDDHTLKVTFESTAVDWNEDIVLSSTTEPFVNPGTESDNQVDVAVKSAGTTVDSGTATLSVVSPPSIQSASITISGDNGDGTLEGGESVVVSASVEGLEVDADESVTVNLSTFGLGTVTLTHDSGTNYSTAAEQVSSADLPADGTYTFTVTATENTGSEDTAQTNAIAVDDETVRTVTASPTEASSNANYEVTFESDLTTSHLVNKIEVDFTALGTNVSGVTADDLALAYDGQSVAITGVSKPDDHTLVVTFDSLTVQNTGTFVLSSQNRAFQNPGSATTSDVDISLHSASTLVESGSDSVTITTDSIPAVADATVSGAPINQSDAGTQQTVTVEFTELMNTSVEPTVNVTGVSNGPVTVSGSYVNATTWVGTVTIADSDEDVTATIEVSGAEDDEGNQISPNPDTSNTFSVDTEEPGVSVQDPYAGGGELVSGNLDLTTVFAVSADDGGETTYAYSTDGGETWNTSEISGTPATLNTSNLSDGTVVLRVVDTDDAGNANSTTVSVVVDNTAPSGLEIVEPTGQVVTNSTAQLDVGYEYNESNPATLKVKISGGDTTVVHDINDSQYVDDGVVKTVTVSSVGNGTDLADGTYNLTVVAEDGAGNVQASDTLTGAVVVNDDAPTLSVDSTIADTTPGSNVTVTYTYGDANDANATIEFRVVDAETGNVSKTVTANAVRPDGTQRTKKIQLPNATGSFHVTLVATNDIGDRVTASSNTFSVARPEEPDTTAPAIESVEAEVGNDAVVVTFSEPVESPDGSVTAADFAYQDRSDGGATKVARAERIDGDEVRLVLDESVRAADLAGSADLVGVRDQAFRDDSGNYVGTEAVALQDTEAPAAPVIASLGDDLSRISLDNQDAFPVTVDLGEVTETVDVTVTLAEVDGDGSVSVTRENVAPSTDMVEIPVDATDLADGEVSVTVTLSDHAPTTHTSSDSADVQKSTDLVVGVDAEQNDTTVRVRFATGVTDANGDALSAANVTYVDANGANASSVVSVEHTAGESTAVVTLDAPVSATDLGNDTVGIVGGDVVDAFGSAADAEHEILGDSLPPQIQEFSAATNASTGEVVVTLVTDERLAELNVLVEAEHTLASERAAPSANLSLAAFSVAESEDGTYTYTTTYDAPRDGRYTAKLRDFADDAGNPDIGFDAERYFLADSVVRDQRDPAVANAYIEEANEFETEVVVTFTEPVEFDGTPGWVSLSGVDKSVAEPWTPTVSSLEFGVEGQLPTGDEPTVTVDGSSYAERYGDGDTGSANTTTIHTTHLVLDEGKNFVSVPAATGSLSLDEVDLSAVEAIWTYDDGNWQRHVPGAPGNDFDSLEGGKGYIFVLESDATIDVNVRNTLTTDQSGNPTLPEQVQLEEGWNLVGHWQEGTQDADVALGSIRGDLFQVYGQVDADPAFEQIELGWRGDRLRPGQAYWVFVTGDTVYAEAAYGEEKEVY
ncbi:MAG: beta strand repeat-containing protein [Halobacteriaceae archaeon]